MQCPLISPHQLWWLVVLVQRDTALVLNNSLPPCNLPLQGGDTTGPPSRHKSTANGDQIIVPLRAEMAGKSIERANWWIKQEI